MIRQVLLLRCVGVCARLCVLSYLAVCCSEGLWRCKYCHRMQQSSVSPATTAVLYCPQYCSAVLPTLQCCRDTLRLQFHVLAVPPSVPQTAQYSTQIFSLAVLLSSLFVYNQMGGIDEAALDRCGGLGLNTNQLNHLSSLRYIKTSSLAQLKGPQQLTQHWLCPHPTPSHLCAVDTCVCILTARCNRPQP